MELIDTKACGKLGTRLRDAELRYRASNNVGWLKKEGSLPSKETRYVQLYLLAKQDIAGEFVETLL